jgi:Disulphide bond corrector protein DsbC
MKRNVICALLVLLATAAAQDDVGLGPKGPVVKMAPAPTVSAVQGKPATETLSFKIANGFHINSNRPKSEYLIPTALKVEATTDIVIGKITYPEGKDMTFAFSPDEKLNVYANDFTVGVLVRPLHTVTPGKYVVRGTLKFQACDNTACYPPKNLPISFDVRITKASSRRASNPAQSPHVHH